MTDDESLAQRLNRMVQQKKQQRDAEERVRLTQEEVNDFIFRNARAEYDRFVNLLGRRIADVNPSLQDVPRFELRQNGPYVKQGNSAAFLVFHQMFTNAGPIHFRVSFGREPEGFYMDEFSQPPTPEFYELEPSLEQNPDRIVWTGDLGEMESERLCDFVLEHLTDYYLEHSVS